MTFSQSNYSWSDAGFSNDPKRYAPPAASVAGTACFLVSLALAYSFYPSEETATLMATVVARIVGIGFIVSVFLDSQQGLRNLLRTDLLCIVGVYGLTLAEFLFPQEEFEVMTTPDQTTLALNIVLIGLAAMLVGRHLMPPKPMESSWLKLDDISNTLLFKVFVVSAFLGYLNMLISVQFNVIDMVDAMLGARFTQPWTRGALGGWRTLVNELALFSYIIPPLTGVIWNRKRFFSKPQIIIVLAIGALTLFHSFASGTRNIFIAHLATLSMGYLLTLPKNTFRNTILPLAAIAFITVYGSYHMLEFRTIGLRNYIDNQVYASESTRDTLAVDYNLASIGWVADAMPQNHDFLGLEVLNWALVRPIPRALWPSKPVGLSVSIEEIAGAEGWTVAATYLGECYMMAGMFGVVSMSMLFGALAAWWNRMAMREQSDYALVVYALGFFAAGITMRSMFWLTTAILPVIALIVFRKYVPTR